MKFNFIYIILLVLVFNCSSSEIQVKGKPEILKININTGNTQFWTQMVDFSEIVKLQFNENSILSGIYKVEYLFGKYFVLDKQKSQALFVYDSKGKFLFRLGKKGEGPGEYLRPKDFLIREKEKRIEILDLDQKKIIIYDLNGKFIKEIRIPVYASSFINIDNLTYGLCQYNTLQGTERFNFYTLNNSGKVIDKGLPFSKKQDQIKMDVFYNFYKVDNQIRLNMSLNDTIYGISKGIIERKYVFDFGKNSLPRNYLDNMQYKDFQKQMNTTDFIFWKHAFETTNYLFFHFTTKDKAYSFIYSKKSKTYKKYDHKSIFDPLAYLLPIAGYSSDMLICVGYPHKLMEHKARFRFLRNQMDKKKCEYLEKQIRTLNDEDNPALFIAKIKPF